MSDLLSGETAPEGEAAPAGEQVETKAFEVPGFLSEFDGINELGEEILGAPCLTSIKDVNGLVKNYVNAQKMVGADKIIIPNEHSTDADKENFWKKLGKPGSLEEFKINLPEETKVEKEFYDEFKKFSFENNILPNQANEMVKFMEQYEHNMSEKFIAEAKETQEANINGLKQEWGDSFDGKINIVNTVIKEFADEDIMNHLKNTGLVNDTKLAKFLASIGEVIYSEKKLDTPAPSSGHSKESAMQEYQSLKQSDAYWNKGHVDHAHTIKKIEKLLPFVHG